MNLLIIEDNDGMRTILREFVRIRAKGLPFEVAVLEAADLKTALELLPRADAVLCDGTFPDAPGAPPVCNWQSISNICYAAYKPFVLLSGDETLVALASQHEVIAFSKNRCPFFRVETAFPPIDTLLGAFSLGQEEERESVGENPVVAEMDEMNRRDAEKEEEQNGKPKRRIA